MNKHFLILLAIFFVLLSCVTIPKESVLLSKSIGGRIAAMQSSHEEIIIDYFQKHRIEVDHFLHEKWIPKFLETYTAETKILSLLENPVVLTDSEEIKVMTLIDMDESYTGQQLVNILSAVNNALGDSERGQIILDFANSALEQISLQRRDMMNVINERERLVLKEIQASYNYLSQMQNVLTSHILSVHKVVDSEDEILKKLNLHNNRDEILKRVLGAQDSLSGILKESGSAIDLAKNFIDLK